jgi:hypothetical protein
VDLVRFELRIPKDLRDSIRMETTRQQIRGLKVSGRISGQYLLGVAAIQNFLDLPESEKGVLYAKAVELIES